MAMFKLVLVSGVTMLVLDGLWLGVLAGGFYFRNLEPLARANAAGNGFDVHYLSAAVVYVCMVTAFAIFIGPDVRGEASLAGTILKSAALGALIYGIYDFTNMATLKHWPLAVTIVDVSWGATLFAITGAVTKAVNV